MAQWAETVRTDRNGLPEGRGLHNRTRVCVHINLFAKSERPPTSISLEDIAKNLKPKPSWGHAKGTKIGTIGFPG